MEDTVGLKNYFDNNLDGNSCWEHRVEAHLFYKQETKDIYGIKKVYILEKK